MTDRVPSDHGTVTSYRTRRERVGRTSRPRVPLPGALDIAVGDVIRISLEGETVHAQVTESFDGDPELRGAFDGPQLARTDGDGEDRLRPWLDSAGVDAGDALVVDVVTPAFKFGLRRPGERVVYEATDPPSSSLADIARDIDG